MSTEPAAPETQARRIAPGDVVVSLLTAAGFAIAQPLYDLLDESAEFFLVRRSPGSDVLLFVLGISLAVPLTMAALALGARAISRRAGDLVHLGFLALLGAMIALPLLRRIDVIDGAPGPVMLIVAATLGALLAYGYARAAGIRIFLRIGSIGAVAFAGAFLFASGASTILFPAAEAETVKAGPIGAPAPVVFIVFDEFPLASLMNADGDIDAELYPSFATLAEDADWYRNAISVHDFTSWAVPAILTGEQPTKRWRAPSLQNHPNNLFTLFGEGYDVHAFESVTQLCPARICAASPIERPADPAFGERWGSLLRDLRVVAGHLYLPERYRRTLPPIDEGVGNFGAATPEPDEPQDTGPDVPANERRPTHDELVADRDGLMNAFVETIEPAERPGLHFIHVFVPHRPWTFLPSGQRYREIIPPAKQKAGWRDDEWLVAQAYQQHLLQAGFADRFIGRVIERLRAADMYDDALIVVTADHGITFDPGVKKVRDATQTSIGEIAAVPLLVKAPGQTRGAIVDDRVSSIDIIPTVAELLDVDLPWDADGISLSVRDRTARRSTVCSQSLTCVTFGVDGRERDRALKAKLRLFPANDPFALAPPGQRDLLGRSPTAFEQRAGSATARIDHLTDYDDVDPEADAVPVALTARLQGVPAGRVIAVAVNGRIRAVTRSYTDDDGGPALLAILPPDSFRDGRNEIALFAVDGTGSGRRLVRMDVADAERR